MENKNHVKARSSQLYISNAVTTQHKQTTDTCMSNTDNLCNKYRHDLICWTAYYEQHQHHTHIFLDKWSLCCLTTGKLNAGQALFFSFLFSLSEKQGKYWLLWGVLQKGWGFVSKVVLKAGWSHYEDQVFFNF